MIKTPENNAYNLLGKGKNEKGYIVFSVGADFGIRFLEMSEELWKKNY